MTAQDVVILAVLIFTAATLYSSIGHAGASAYLAAMALFGLAPQVMRPTALALNIIVAVIGTVRFIRAGYFSWAVFWPFAVSSIPLAFIGGMIQLPGEVYRPIVALVLLFAAFRLVFLRRAPADAPTRPLPKLLAIALGAGLGLLAGLTGVGGGIFLSPLLILMRWADVRTTSGVSASFILVNSVAGLLGAYTTLQFVPPAVGVWAVAAVLGGLLGTELGTRRFNNLALRRVLAVVLVIAAYKLTFT
jgi:uncharacterized membrane protein YfcA